MPRQPRDRFGSLDLSVAEQASRFAHIITASERADGQPPFSDQSLVDLRSGARTAITVEHGGIIAGAAVHTVRGGFAEAELVIDPALRRTGLGGALLERLLDDHPTGLAIWAHGDHRDARALAARHRLTPIRELLQLRLTPVVAPSGPLAPVSAFRPGIDDADWLHLNALAFATHAEQGGMTQADLDARLAEPWFDADDFLIARDQSGSMTGFCWLKVEGGVGEFYAVAVAPQAQGTGLGRGLVSAGLLRLVSCGIRESSLYVEGDNLTAVGLYRSVGFTDHSIDIQYRTPESAHVDG